MITVWFGGGQAGGCFASGMGPPWGLSSRSGISWGRPWVLRRPQGSARRAERSEPLWFPGVRGQALLPGREDRLGHLGGRAGGAGAAPPRSAVAGRGLWLLAGSGDGGFLPVPVGLAVDDQFVGGGLEPVGGGGGEQGVGHQGQPVHRFA